MTVDFHPLAVRDLLETQAYYSRISSELSKDFRRELDSLVEQASANPAHFHFLSRRSRFRRANMNRFPYNLVYEVWSESDEIKVVCVRHDKRHPSHGLNRRWE